jgi:hypothetical protein
MTAFRDGHIGPIHGLAEESLAMTKHDEDAAAKRQALLAGEHHEAASAMKAAAPTRPAAGGSRRPVAAAAPPAVDHAMVASAVAAAMTAIQSQQAARAGTPNLDKTIPGGCYIVEGVCVNAHNEIIEHPDEAGEALEAWYDQQAELQAPALAAAAVAAKEAEAEGQAELTDEEKKVQADNEARAVAADEVRKRAEAAAKDLGKSAKDKKD